MVKQTFKSLDTPDVQYSIKGEGFEAIKYLSVKKSYSQLFAIIEIAWDSLAQARLIHENLVYIEQKEEKIVTITKETIN